MLHPGSEDTEGPYRVWDFIETVSSRQIEDIAPLATHLLETVHTSKYLRKIKTASMKKSVVAEVRLAPESYDSIYVSAALSVIAACDGAFAITRPPGHHASKENAEGFCFINNAAIATKSLLEKGKRVLIIDIDGHYGNGTESLFEHESNVMYVSIHSEDEYPAGRGQAEIRAGIQGKSNLVSVPIPKGSGDDIFLEALAFVICLTKDFNPGAVVVSAGFDGYADDTLLDLRYSLRGYAEAGRMISSLEKQTCAVLEGGYHPYVKVCVDAFVSGLSGNEIEMGEPLSGSASVSLSRFHNMLAKMSND